MGKEKEVILKSKAFRMANGDPCHVRLIKSGMMYGVKVDGIFYKKTANQLFAVQMFNAI